MYGHFYKHQSVAKPNNRPVVLVHGFNVSDAGAGTTDTLIRHLSDWPILDADYGRIGLAGVRLYADNFARMLAGLTPEGAIGIGHSNGCNILLKAVEFGAPYKQLILINPALDNDAEFPLQLDRVDVYHNIHDRVVTASRILIWHPWGDMGRVGYTGKDQRVYNHETFQLLGVSGHSAVFEKHNELSQSIKGVMLK